MGFRFRKSLSIFPGVRLNISKSGISTSIGRPGATINVGNRGVRGTVGLPGSGLSYSDMLVTRRGKANAIDTSRLPETSGTGFAAGKVILIGSVIVFVVVGLLFFAGLRSARQSDPTAGFRPVSQSSIIPKDIPAARPKAQDPQDVSGAVSGVTNSANCRANPNARAKIVTVLAANEHLTVVDKQAGWSRVTTNDVDCWVSSSLVK
jgi:hypothetical protein